MSNKIPIIVCDSLSQINDKYDVDFESIINECDKLSECGYMKPAGVGKGDAYYKASQVRDDNICWIGPAGGMKKIDVLSIQDLV